jgi:hypothetical protein
LLDIGDGKVTTDETGCIKLPNDFCTIIYSQDALIDQICSSVHRQYTNHEWLAERAILVAKNVEVNELNLKIQNLLPENLVFSKMSIDLTKFNLGRLHTFIYLNPATTGNSANC